MLSSFEIVNEVPAVAGPEHLSACSFPFVGCMDQSNVNNVIILWFALTAAYHMVVSFMSKDCDDDMWQSVTWKKHCKFRKSHCRFARFYRCQRRCKRRRKHASDSWKKNDQCPISRLICSMPPPLPFYRHRKRTTPTTEPVEAQLVVSDPSVSETVAKVNANDQVSAALAASVTASDTETSKKDEDAKQKKRKSQRRASLQPSLLDMSRMQQWIPIEQRLELTTKEAKGRDADGLMPLHWACSGGPPVSTVKALIQAYPKAARRVDSEGSTALHFAAHYGGSIAVVETLLEAYPPAIRMQDRYGRTPLYHAVAKSAGLDVLRALVEAEPAMAMTPCVPPTSGDEDSTKQVGSPRDRTPLYTVWVAALSSLRTRPRSQGRAWDKAVLLLQATYLGYTKSRTSKSASSRLPKLSHSDDNRGRNFRLVHAAVTLDSYLPEALLPRLVERHPEQVREADDSGRLPLAIAASLTQVTADRSDMLIKLLLEAYPQAGNVSDTNGHSPLTLALASGKRWDWGVERLFLAAPDQLNTRDPSSGLYPALLAATAQSLEEDDREESSSNQRIVLDFQSTTAKALDWRKRILTSRSNHVSDSPPTEISESVNQVSTIFELLQADPAVVKCAAG